MLEGDSVELVVQKAGLFDSDIEFQITTNGLFVGAGYFGAGGTDFVTTVNITLVAPDNDIALEDDVIAITSLFLVTIHPQIIIRNGVIPVTIQDDDGKGVYIALYNKT